MHQISIASYALSYTEVLATYGFTIHLHVQYSGYRIDISTKNCVIATKSDICKLNANLRGYFIFTPIAAVHFASLLPMNRQLAILDANTRRLNFCLTLVKNFITVMLICYVCFK